MQRQTFLLLILLVTSSILALAVAQPVHAQGWGCGYWNTRYCYGYCGYGYYYGCYGYGYTRYYGYPSYYNAYQYQVQPSTVTIINTVTQNQVQTVLAPPVFVTQTMVITSVSTTTEDFLNSDTGFATLIFAVIALMVAVIFGLLYATRPTKTVEVPQYIQPAQPSPPPSQGFCSTCGKPLPIQANFCSNCGSQRQRPT